nr:MAG TPA: hypothetical protein [Crassvirales sp.]
MCRNQSKTLRLASSVLGISSPKSHGLKLEKS